MSEQKPIGEQLNVVWSPQAGPQQALIECPLPLVGYGGARGGGKTDGVLGKFGILAETMGQTFNGVFFRKELPQADDLIERAKQIYLPLEAHYNDQKKQFTFKGGGRLRFRPLANNADAEKYQGQNLCVAIGTRLRMADGSFKPIETIEVGEYVATLSGPQKVTHTIKPYLAPCVESRVWDQDGTLVGVQRSPIWHPVLTAHGVFSNVANYEQHNIQTPHIDWRSQQWALSVCSEVYKSRACADLEHRAWYASLKDGKTYCTKSLDDNPKVQQLPKLSVPVALHAQTVLLKKKHGCCDHDASTGCCAPSKLDEQLSDSNLLSQTIRLGFEQLHELFAPALGLPWQLDDDVSNVLPKTKTTANFQADCRSCRGSNDEHSHLGLKTDLNGPPLPGDAVELPRTLNVDESGTIQKHSPEHLPSWVHPYSGEAMRLVEDVVFGRMESTYVGECLVTDITVDGANHYISDTGLINKNSHAAVEEAGNYNTPEPIFKLFGALRGGTNPQIILTFNPGGSGHHWLKERFIKPAPKGWKILQWPIGNGKTIDYIYIPSRVHDNKILLDKDPGYIDRLHMVGSPELVRAWLEGDFEIHEGSYFPEFSGKHIVTPFNVPKHWPKYLGFDWGYRSPFAAVWGAICSGKNDEGREVEIPKGAIVIYREMWGRQIENKEQAERIASVSIGENVHAVADPAIFSSQGGPSINDQFNAVFSKFKHPSFRAADNDRISGWTQLRRRLQHDPPMLYFFSTCPYLIESLPALQLDPKNHEDADSSGDDHACDALRYLCKERLLDSLYEKPVEKSVHKGRVKLQLYVNQIRAEQKRAKL